MFPNYRNLFKSVFLLLLVLFSVLVIGTPSLETMRVRSLSGVEVFGSYNTTFGTTNVAECANFSSDTESVDFSVFRIDGSLVNTKLIDIPGQGVQHIIINEFQDSAGHGVDEQYGSYVVRTNSGKKSIYCQTMSYKLRASGDLEYAFATPNTSVTGKRYGFFNSFNPSITATGPTLNWLTLQNTSESESHYRVEMHYGAEVVVQEVNLAANARFDIPLGHQLGAQTAGYYVIIPDSNREYLSYLSRFASSSVGITAFQQETTDPLREQSVSISTMANTRNWLSMANPSVSSAVVLLRLRDETGEVIHQSRRTLSGESTSAVFVNELLDPNSQGKIGSADVRVLANGPGVIVESGFYGADSNSPQDTRWAYTRNAVAPRLGPGNKASRVALVNTYLGAANWLKLSSVGNIERKVSSRASDGSLVSEVDYPLAARASLDVDLHGKFGADRVGLAEIDSYIPAKTERDHLLRVYYLSDGSIGAIAPISLPEFRVENPRALEPDRQITSDRLFQNSYLIYNEARTNLTNTGSSAGSYTETIDSSRSLLIQPESGASNRKVTLRIPLSVGDDFFWTFSSRVLFKTNGSEDVTVSVVAAERDASLKVLRYRTLEEFTLGDSDKKYVNFNLDSPLLETKQVVFFVTFESTRASGFSSNADIELVNPLLLRKQKTLRAGTVLGFIDADTLLALNPIHERQLEQLSNRGHTLWVLGLRANNQFGFDIEEMAEQAKAAILANPQLRDSKFVLGAQRIFTHRLCDIAEYLDRGGSTFDYPPLYVRSYDGSTGEPPEDGVKVVKVRENCVDPLDSSDPRQAFFEAELEDIQTVVGIFGNLVGGVYIIDEAASHGLPVPYLEQVYEYLSSKLPNIPLFLTNSFYIGSSNLADRFPEEISKNYYAPSVADIQVVDYYTIPSLRAGRVEQQQRFLDFLESHKMLSKPFVRLVGSAVNSLAPCTLSFSEYKSVYDLTMSVRESVSEESQGNWANLGMWGFYNKEARSSAVFSATTWDATFASQEEGYCDEQFQGYLRFSQSFRF